MVWEWIEHMGLMFAINFFSMSYDLFCLIFFILFYFAWSDAAITVQRALETCSGGNSTGAIGRKQETGKLDNFSRRKGYWELWKEKGTKESKVREKGRVENMWNGVQQVEAEDNIPIQDLGLDIKQYIHISYRHWTTIKNLALKSYKMSCF